MLLLGILISRGFLSDFSRFEVRDSRFEILGSRFEVQDTQFHVEKFLEVGDSLVLNFFIPPLPLSMQRKQKNLFLSSQFCSKKFLAMRWSLFICHSHLSPQLPPPIFAKFYLCCTYCHFAVFWTRKSNGLNCKCEKTS